MPRLRAIIWRAVSSQAQTAPDKISLDEQKRLLVEFCEKNDLDIIDDLVVPGHSRSEPDLFTMFDAYAAIGCFAFHKLREHWIKKDFDVYVCYEDSRIYRSPGGVAMIMDCILKSGARIYRINGGWIDESNAEYSIAFATISAPAGIKRTNKMRDAAMIGRMDRGLTMTGVPFSHRLVRDPVTGKALYLELRDELRPLFDDAATLLLEGVGWRQFSVELARRFQHYNPDTGDPFHDNSFQRFFYNPYTWGAAAKGFAHKYGLWALDETAPLPEGVKIVRSPNPPVPAVYSGQQAELVKAELKRRWHVGHGRAYAKSQYAFTGLMVCQLCGRRMAVESSRRMRRGYFYWRCPHRERYLAFRGKQCSNTLTLPNAVAQQQINDFLIRLLKLKKPELAALSNKPTENQAVQVGQLQSRIAALQKQIDSMILRQASAPENVVDRYTKQIQAASIRLTNLERELQQAQSQLEPESVRRNRHLAYDELAVTGLDAFWQWEPYRINQLLHRLMGKHRFAVLGKQIVDIV